MSERKTYEADNGITVDLSLKNYLDWKVEQLLKEIDYNVRSGLELILRDERMRASSDAFEL